MVKCHIHALADGKVKAPNGPNRSLLGHFIWKMDENGKVAMEGWGWLGPIFKSCILPISANAGPGDRDGANPWAGSVFRLGISKAMPVTFGCVLK